MDTIIPMFSSLTAPADAGTAAPAGTNGVAKSTKKRWCGWCENRRETIHGQSMPAQKRTVITHVCEDPFHSCLGVCIGSEKGDV